MVTEFFSLVIGVLPGDTLTPLLFIICQDYLLRKTIDLMKENSFTQTHRHKKGKKQMISRKKLSWLQTI